MPSRKRSFQTANEDHDDVSPLHHIRNMWQFANFVEWIYIFGKAAKIDDSIDVEVEHIAWLSAACAALLVANHSSQVIETELLKPSSTILQDIALALLKLAASFRGLT